MGIRGAGGWARAGLVPRTRAATETSAAPQNIRRPRVDSVPPARLARNQYPQTSTVSTNMTGVIRSPSSVCVSRSAVCSVVCSSASPLCAVKNDVNSTTVVAIGSQIPRRARKLGRKAAMISSPESPAGSPGASVARNAANGGRTASANTSGAPATNPPFAGGAGADAPPGCRCRLVVFMRAAM